MITEANKYKEWAEEIWNKVEKKLEHTAPLVGDSFFPYTTENGQSGIQKERTACGGHSGGTL